MPAVPRVRVGGVGPPGVSVTNVTVVGTDPVVLRFALSDGTNRDVAVPLTIEGGVGGGPVTSGDIVDATALGQLILTAADAAAVKAALSLVINDISNATTVGKALLGAATAAAARDAIGTIAVPSGGSDGNPLVKSGSGVAWGSTSMTQARIKGRAAGAGTGDPTDLDAAQVLALLTAGDRFALAVPGTVVVVDGDGEDWAYAGDVLTARPTASTHVRFLLVDPTGDMTSPAWALPGLDLMAQEWGG